MSARAAELGGEYLLGGELVARAAQSATDCLGGARELDGELAVRLAVEDTGEHSALLGGQRRPGCPKGGELLVDQQNAHGVAMSSGWRRRTQVADRGRRDGQGWGAVQRQRSAEQLVLVRPGGAECGGRLGAHAVGGEREKRPASWLPGADRTEQRDPGFLDDVSPLAATGQPQATDDVANQRLVAAQQLLLGARVAALRGEEQCVFVGRGDVASSKGGSHARGWSAGQ